MINTNVSDLLARLRNGYNAHRSTICVNSSKHSLCLLKIFQNYGLIHGISQSDNKELKVFLKYTAKTKALFSIGGLSKPSIPVYFSFHDLWKFHKSYGILIVHTSQGIMCHHSALKKKIGGQVVCYIL